MAINNFQFNFSNEDWSDPSAYIWSEYNGHKYLSDINVETGKFYNLYIKHRHVINHLDFIFLNMRWKRPEAHVRSLDDEKVLNDINITTFHCSPLNIACMAIFSFIENILDITTKHECCISQREYFEMYRLFNKILINQQQGIYSIDSNDYVLAICHFKTVISVINAMLALVVKIEQKDNFQKENIAKNCLQDIRTAMYDIRELAWQAILFCNSVPET